MLNKLIAYFLDNKLIVFLLGCGLLFWGLSTTPFNWSGNWIPKDPVPVDAIPDLGENQQIVEVQWTGRSPEDVENQITYPLTTQLLGVPGVKTVRSTSMLGFSSIFVIFNEDVDFYWSRTRILEKLSSLPAGLIPDDVKPVLGPDATGLGQVFWYTLEGRDKDGNPTGGWDSQELRSIQDFYVDYALSAVEGVSEVASIGGYVKEYQIELNPIALQQYNLTVMDIAKAVKESNRDVGARTLEINKVEYLVRGLGYIKSIADLESIVLKTVNRVPITLNNVAKIQVGPAQERGFLDKSGAEATGGVIVARYGSNPLQVIHDVKEKVKQISSGLPTKTLTDGTVSQVQLVPFYDRTGLIKETLATLEDALILQVLVTMIVVILIMLHVRASIIITGLLPLAVLAVFIAMRYAGVDANIVALSGIAIAIGTMVDMGIILTEHILYVRNTFPNYSLRDAIYTAATEVGSAIITAVSTTVVSFLPVFTMIGAEGKLFKPLAYTKTFALVSSILIALFLIPSFAHFVLGFNLKGKKLKLGFFTLFLGFSIYVISFGHVLLGFILAFTILNSILAAVWKAYPKAKSNQINTILLAILISVLLAQTWMPLGVNQGLFINFVFVASIISGLLGLFYQVIRLYETIIRWALSNRVLFLSIPSALILFGVMIWLGWRTLFSPVLSFTSWLGFNDSEWKIVQKMDTTFPGLGKEFMPTLDEGSFLLMPSLMPHAGVEEVKEYLSLLDKAVTEIPEVESVIGKAGRANTALDPAPISMFENVIIYKTEYVQDENGRKIRVRKLDDGTFVPDKNGEFVRQWRDHIKTPDDIWHEIVAASQFPGITSAPKLQPIETRMVMLQSGMRSPMGIKIKGGNLDQIEQVGLELETILKGVPSIEVQSVFAERSVGKPYLEIDWDRKKLARFGLKIEEVQQFLEMALGGMPISTSIEGRERYPIRIRYAREWRNDPDKIENMLIQTANGESLKIKDLATVSYKKGPQMIRSEDTFLTSYVLFDKKSNVAEIQVIDDAKALIQEYIEHGLLELPHGVTFEFSGTYENQIRAESRLKIVLPLALALIFLILYFQFRSISTTAMIFSSIFVAWSGGFILLWLYGQSWFMNFSVFDNSIRSLFQMDVINLSVAVWVGFIALFGIASDDGVLIATFIQQKTKEKAPENKSELKELVIEAGLKRIKPALMTSATTILALLPVLSSTGKGSDIMVPMAIPTFGGMSLCLVTLFVIPVLYYSWNSRKLN